MKLYDTTLRDGTQSKDVNLTLKDKISVVKLLDDCGMDYIELGWPSSTPKDMEAFKIVSKMRLKNSRIVAFSSTRKKGILACDDPSYKALLESKAKTITIFGKTWHNHINLQLNATLDENLEMITDSIKFLKQERLEVFYDAEHFFDGYKSDKEYALKCIKTALEAGADSIVLCDTNGGTLPNEILEIAKQVKHIFSDARLGIHCHNDSGCAVANSLMCHEIIEQIQGTINGFGERAGNADLIQIIPALELKLGIKTNFRLKRLKEVSDLLYILTNLKNNPNQPYVGNNAFSHKAGVHVDAISKGASYEHIEPSLIGNIRKIILSDLSGSANIIQVLHELGIHVDKKDDRVKQMLQDVKILERKGYDINDLDAEKYLLANKYFGNGNIFKVNDWKITTQIKNGQESSECEISGIVDGKDEFICVKVDAQGPVDSAYLSIKTLVSKYYSKINNLKLYNYKVMIAEDNGAESSVRVYIEFENGNEKFATTGVSKNIIEASVEAIEKGFRYYILRNNLN